MADAGRSRRLEELFHLGASLAENEREAFIARHCAADQGLGEELRALLHEDAQGTAPALARNPLLPTPSSEERVGRYRLIERIGEGGMGAVYLAEQEEPVRRRVALKMIRLGMDTERTAARFASERQALALMNHPAIARILDGGTTDSGRPYFVMEYVPGPPVTEYCARTGCTLTERLELFCRICDGVQHAHQKGIVHRDLKPGNVLVTEHDGNPQPKIIDFGIALALSDPEHEVIGTRPYMSPEQADPTGPGVDARTDIFALGALLRELIGTAPKRDLEWIIRKAVAHAPAERYPSASELRADVERHLAHEPVAAAPSAPGYLIQKFIARHRVGFVSSVAAFAGLVIALYSTWVSRADALVAAASAERAAQKSGALVEFLNHALFEAHTLLHDDNELTVREMLDLATPGIAGLFLDQPIAESAVRSAIGKTYLYLGEDDRACEQLRAAYALQAPRESEEPYDLFATLSALITATRRLHGIEAAQPYVEQALEIANSELPDRRPELAGAAAAMLAMARGGTIDDETLAGLDELMAALPRVARHGDESRIVGRVLVEAGAILLQRGHTRTDSYFDEIEVRARALLPPDHISFLDFLWILVNVRLYPDQENFETARRLAAELDERVRKTLPVEHWLRADAQRLLGLALAGLGREAEAEEFILEAAHAAAGGQEHHTSRVRATLAGPAQLAGSLDEEGVTASWKRWRERGADGVDARPWWVVARPGIPRAAVEQAVALLAAEDREPVVLRHEAIGLYRLGRYGPALAALDGAAAEEGGEPPAALAFRALCLWKLERREDARSARAALRERADSDGPLLELVREVDATLSDGT